MSHSQLIESFIRWGSKMSSSMVNTMKLLDKCSILICSFCVIKWTKPNPPDQIYTINAKILNLYVYFAFFGEWTKFKSVITFEIMCVFECIRWISFSFSHSPFIKANKYSECNKNCCRSVLCYQLRLFLSTRNSSILKMRCAFIMGAAIDRCAYTDIHTQNIQMRD